MPTKLKPSQAVRDRVTGKIVTQHFYLKQIANGELIETYNSKSTKAKVKRKIKVELERRNKIGKANVVFG